MAKIIKTDGTEVPFERVTLKTMQEAVEGYIEPVRAGERMLIVNEEGAMRHRTLPDNPVASALAGRPLVGHVIVFTAAEWAAVSRGAEEE